MAKKQKFYNETFFEIYLISNIIKFFKKLQCYEHTKQKLFYRVTMCMCVSEIKYLFTK